LAVDVDILPVKTRAAFLEGFPENVPHRVKQATYCLGAKTGRFPLTVNFDLPERFVGIDVPHTTDQCLVEQCAFHTGVFSSKRGDKQIVVEKRVKRVAGNMGCGFGDARKRRAVTPGVVVRGINERVKSEVSKDALVNETEGGVFPGRVVDVEGDSTQSRKVVWPVADENVTGHSKVGNKCAVRVVGQPPQKLPPTDDVCEGGASKSSNEILRWSRVAFECPGFSNDNVTDCPGPGEGDKTASDNLNFGKLGH
jgi:hypothetical protein